ncbi:MAG: hypothetical protein H6813_02840 [Phycisphaeraceae bacterium]|nr:hypothetical protein [Phycisphaeraceae bacterium]MCB9848747.1 hypothetical protein [Phycisphaeraceae bacterium]
MSTRLTGVAILAGFACFCGMACGQCVEPDNGFGTATMPPAACSYSSPMGDMHIIDGLPAGDTIDIDVRLENFFPVNEAPGGLFGGTTTQYGAQLVLPMQGTGSLSGFSRFIVMQLPNDGTNFFDCFPRVNGDPIQQFEMQLRAMSGDYFGDPDFCILRIRAGVDLGLPTTGYTTLQSAPANSWHCDSFFDLNYSIEFQGCPGSPLDGFSGTTFGLVRITTDLCPTDLNNDGVTDTSDLGILLSNFGGPGPLGDLNNDGVVDTADLGLLLNQFGTQCFPV